MRSFLIVLSLFTVLLAGCCNEKQVAKAKTDIENQKAHIENQKAHDELYACHEVNAGGTITLDDLQVMLLEVRVYDDKSVALFYVANTSGTHVRRLHLPLTVSYLFLPTDSHGNFYYQFERSSYAPRWDEEILYPGESVTVPVFLEKLIAVPDLTLKIRFEKHAFCGFPENVRFVVPADKIVRKNTVLSK